jgi:hypothetical protein
MDYSYPDTPEKRKAGMAAFRAKMLKAHAAMLAGGDPNTAKRGKTGEAARKYHADMIESIKRAQARFGEV